MSQPQLESLPDISRMNDLKEAFLKQLYSSTEALLPALREQLHGLSRRLLDTDRLLSERVLSALVLLGNHKWHDPASLLAQTPGQAGILEQDALRDLHRLESQGQEIADALAALGKARLPAVDERGETLVAQLESLDRTIANQKARIDDLDQRVAAMDQVIAAFEAPQLQSIFKSLIPTEEEVLLMQKLLLKGVDPQTLIAAARIFVDRLGGVLEGRKFIDVVKLRSRTLIDRGVLIDERCAWETRHAALARELDQLPKVAVLDGMRDQWLEQAVSLTQGWTEQIQAARAQTELAPMADALTAMERYLLAVRRRYEEA